MYTPTLAQVKALKPKDGNLVPVYREINADLETPVSAYLKIADGPYSFLLESVEGGERFGRYSFLGASPYQVLKTGPGQPQGPVDPLRLVERELSAYHPIPVSGLPRFLGGAIGYLGYDCIRYFEPRVPVPQTDPLGLPEAVLMFTDTVLVFDHLKHKIQVVSHVRLDGDVSNEYEKATQRIDKLVARLRKPLRVASQDLPHEGSAARTAASSFRSNVSQERFHQMVRRARDYIIQGDVIQVVLSQRLARPVTADSFALYRTLRRVNPSPYMYYLNLDDFQIVGASPEMLVRVEEGEIAMHPIAGTRPRSLDAAQDLALEQELRTNEKERAEHIMLVDLGRNDVGRVSLPGSVQVTQLMDVERYSHVMHLVSHVAGRLDPRSTCYDALRSSFPAGTVSGAPKIRAMEIIADLEGERRGPYSGAVGYFSFSGNMDTAITIRTMVVKNGMAYIQAGAGIVYDSQEEAEYQETLHKAQALLQAVDETEASSKGDEA